jgi:hypothetical protein
MMRGLKALDHIPVVDVPLSDFPEDEGTEGTARTTARARWALVRGLPYDEGLKAGRWSGSMEKVWGRWFGDAGDVEVRRDGGCFRWRWVGNAGVRPPANVPAEETDFFTAAEGHPPPVLRAADDTALLWDRADGRVATADTETTLSLLSDGSRLRLRYTAYYDETPGPSSTSLEPRMAQADFRCRTAAMDLKIDR